MKILKDLQDLEEAKKHWADKFSNARITKAVGMGMDAFFAAVAKEFPEVKTGDFTPHQTVRLQDTLEKAVADWLINNYKP